MSPSMEVNEVQRHISMTKSKGTAESWCTDKSHTYCSSSKTLKVLKFHTDVQRALTWQITTADQTFYSAWRPRNESQIVQPTFLRHSQRRKKNPLKLFEEKWTDSKFSDSKHTSHYSTVNVCLSNYWETQFVSWNINNTHTHTNHC